MRGLLNLNILTLKITRNNKRTKACWCLQISQIVIWNFHLRLLSWVSWPRRQKWGFLFLNLQWSVFWEYFVSQLLCITSALWHIRKTAGPVCQCLSLFSHSWHIHMTASNVDVMRGNGGETLTSMLTTSEDIRCTGKARSYLEGERKMGHCLSAASLTAFSHNNWSAFVDTLILMRPNPLFSPQWIHR